MDEIPSLLNEQSLDSFKQRLNEVLDTLSGPREYLSFLNEMQKQVDLRNNKYVYMVTFTLDPSKGRTGIEVEQYIEHQATRDVLQIKKLEYSQESHESGLPHYHCLFVTTSCLKKDRFWGYTKGYGNVDISKNMTSKRDYAQQIKSIRDYISKENPIIVVL